MTPHSTTAAPQSANPNRRSQVKTGLWGAALSALLGLALWSCPFISDWFGAVSFDALSVTLGSQSITNVVIVALDEESHQRLGQRADRLWDRALHERLVETLIGRGARAIVFDVLFADKWPDPAVDQAFAQVLKRATEKVILAGRLLPFEEVAGAGGAGVLAPIEPLGSAAPWGFVELRQDHDGVLRFASSVVPNSSGQTQLAWKTAEMLGVAPSDPERPRWIGFYGPCSLRDPPPFRLISYWQALQPGALPPDVFSNKVVFVGQSRVAKARGANTGDEYPTALTRWTGQLSSGVEIQATVFANLWRRDWLQELPAAAETALFVLCGAAFGLGLSLVKPLPALGWAGAGALVTGIGAVILFRSVRLWYPWLIVAEAQIPFALAWSVLGFFLRAARVKDIPDHELLRCVGRGGYGEVWLAQDTIGGFHAVKIIHRKNFQRSKRRSPGVPERDEREPFEREFRGITNFAPISRSHWGLVHILHVGRNDLRGSFYYIMEAADDERRGQDIEAMSYVPRTLARDIARHGRLSVAECVQLGLDLTAALEFLHQRQLIHRDIKPANIIFVNGKPKLADAGLVRSMREAPEGIPTSQTGQQPLTRLGTSGYLAPEGPGIPGDVYALGKTLYESATGCECVCFPELPTDLAAGAEADALLRFHEILLTACETDPADRYPSAAAMREQLLDLQNSLTAKV